MNNNRNIGGCGCTTSKPQPKPKLKPIPRITPTFLDGWDVRRNYMENGLIDRHFTPPPEPEEIRENLIRKGLIR